MNEKDRKYIMQLYVVYDKVAEGCGPVFEAVNDLVAIRSFKQMMNSTVNGCEGDYELWRIGEIDKGAMQLYLMKERVPYTYERE